VSLWKHIARKPQLTASLLAKPSPRNVNLGNDRSAMFNKKAGHPRHISQHFVDLPCLRFVNHLHAACYRSPRDIAMNSIAREYIKRATECVRIAEAENDDDVRIFLVNLASAWARAAAQEKAKSFQSEVRPAVLHSGS
jgi:hypothetical protein